LKPKHIQKVYMSMLERGLSSRVVRYTHAVLSSALKQPVRQQTLVRNPAELVDLPRKEQREMKAFTPEEAGRFLTAVDPRQAARLPLP
jgi:integrase